MRVLEPALCLWLLISALAPTLVAQGRSGALNGVVVDSETGTALPGARVEVVGAGLSTTSDFNGTFHLAAVPSGTHTVEVSYLGYEVLTLQIEISAASLNRLDVRLRTLSRESATVIAEPLRQGQAKALNQQKTASVIENVVSADQIGRFPDPNAAEAIQRITGVTLQRDQGEGRFISVRGTEARLNTVAINGERLPSPEGDIRFVALDVIPADVLEAIELTKAPTADMDADAIGGQVNLQTKRAPEDPLLTFSGGWGFNNLVRDDLQNFSLAAGKRFRQRRLGILFAASWLNTARGSDAYELSYGAGDVRSFDLSDSRIDRKRLGLVLGFDYRIDGNSEFFLNTVFNQFDDRTLRRTKRLNLEAEAIERDLTDRFIRQRIASLQAGGRHFFDNLFQLDYTISYSYASEDEPDRADSFFVQPGVTFEYGPSSGSGLNSITPLNEDLAAFELDRVTGEDNFSRDQDLAVSINLARPFSAGNRANGLWKVGFKYKSKEKQLDNNLTDFRSEEPIQLSSVLDSRFDPGNFLGGRYAIGAFPDAAAIRSLLPNLESEPDLGEDLVDYLAAEDIWAAFAMAELNWSERFQLVPGLRIEYTDTSYRGNQLVFDQEGETLSSGTVTGRNDYLEFHPSVNFRYRIDQLSNLRAAFSRTLARPNHEELVPFSRVSREELEILRGNPELRPTTSWNYDLLWEHYFRSVGVISAGVFFKDLRDSVYISRFRETLEAEEFVVFQPRNLPRARLVGVETAFQRALPLPSPLDGLGVYANYTFSRSEADLPGRQAGASRLPGQAQHVYNLAVSYEKYGFSGRLSWNFHDRYLSEVGEDSFRDVYIDRHLQLDLSLSQRLSRHVSVVAEFVNLTNEPFRSYESRTDRPLQREFYSWWGSFGLEFNF